MTGHIPFSLFLICQLVWIFFPSVLIGSSPCARFPTVCLLNCRWYKGIVKLETSTTLYSFLSSPKPTPVAIRVKNADDADNLMFISLEMKYTERSDKAEVAELNRKRRRFLRQVSATLKTFYIFRNSNWINGFCWYFSEDGGKSKVGKNRLRERRN